jgi:hypothetical protein
MRQCITAVFAVLLIATSATAQTPVPRRVELDSTGVARWRFVNPVNPQQLDPGQALLFENTTGDRTFVVTIPFVYSTTELTRAYAISTDQRGGRVASEIVCKALGGCNPNVQEDVAAIDDIDTLEGMRTFIEGVSSVKKPGVDWCGLDDAACAIETLFWVSSCETGGVSDNDLKKFIATGVPPLALAANLKADAEALLDFVFNLPVSAHAWPRCPLDDMRVRRKRILDTIAVTGASKPPIDVIAAAARSTGRKERFEEERTRVAREALLLELKSRVNDHIKVTLAPVFKRLEALREGFERDVKRATEADVVMLQCRLREVEAAGRLLRSYGEDAEVPFEGLPLTLITDATCAQAPAQAAATLGYAQEIESSIQSRANEQGIEISDCDRDATPMLCMATATVPPYQSATFSASILAHHPQPRIRFNVTFFGETETPANPTGFVRRADARPSDQKPKSQFAFTFGSDASVLLDPPADLVGQRRHSSGTGALTFQHSGPFEVTATLQYKRGDFGVQPASSQVEATQYQAKVFGLAGLVFQYGKTLFARPSSGIAVSLTGEGFQTGWGFGSLAYVVNRESDAGTADRQDDDHDVWLGQLKSVPIRMPFLRTVDAIILYGEEKKDDAAAIVKPDGSIEIPPLPRPYEYWTAGAETRFGIRRFPSFGGSIAGYHSRRNVGPRTPEPDRPVVDLRDGQGSVALLRLSWTRLMKPPLTELKQKMRPTFGVNTFVGYGSGDQSDDGRSNDYLGENAGYANDVLFLSTISKTKKYAAVGQGLANKWYSGVQLTNSRFSPLSWIADLLRSQEDVESRATIFSVHSYWFHEPVQQKRFGGIEGNVEFQLESPKNVRWSIVGAYYHRSAALERLGLEHNPWSLAAKVSISLR